MRYSAHILLATLVALGLPTTALYDPDAQPQSVALELAIVACDEGLCLQLVRGSLDDLRAGVDVELKIVNDFGEEARFLLAITTATDEAGSEEAARRMPIVDVAVPVDGIEVAAQIPGDATAVTMSAQTAAASDEIHAELAYVTILAMEDGEMENSAGGDAGTQDDPREGIPGASVGLVLLALGALAAAFSRRL